MLSLTLSQVFTDLAEDLTYGRPNVATLADGSTLRASYDYEQGMTLEDSGDWYGRYEYFEYRHAPKQRPSWCNGAARKFAGRDGFVWWMPPADCTTPEQVEAIAKRVQGYVRDDWAYIYLTLTLTPAPCAHGQLASRSASCGGIESDSGAEYFAEVLADLYAEVGAA